MADKKIKNAHDESRKGDIAKRMEELEKRMTELDKRMDRIENKLNKFSNQLDESLYEICGLIAETRNLML